MENLLRRIQYTQQELKALNLEAKEKLIKIITEVADSHKINRIDNKCFIVKKSELIGKPWSPSYFDWKESGKTLLKKLDDLFIKNNREPTAEFIYFLNELLNQKNQLQKGVCSIYTKQGTIPINAEMVKAIIAKINA
jgi:hypothetical protein